jgi:hypothetical protein
MGATSADLRLTPAERQALEEFSSAARARGADDLAGAVFTEAEVREMLANAETFLSEVERMLKP